MTQSETLAEIPPSVLVAIFPKLALLALRPRGTAHATAAHLPLAAVVAVIGKVSVVASIVVAADVIDIPATVL